jgi:murein DD-endopeptidase MepM/ murein hydrolase activator NlpD
VSRRLVVLSSLFVALLAAPAGAAGYQPPVHAPVVDGFRLPDGPYGPGNRGLEYATEPGTPVRAIGPGVVVFAGPVAGSLHVTVLHPDALRSSYSFLAEVLVEPGDRVVAGHMVGRSGERLHLGVRSAAGYLDPATLFAVDGARLVPLDGGVPATPPARPGEGGGMSLRMWDWLVRR